MTEQKIKIELTRQGSAWIAKWGKFVSVASTKISAIEGVLEAAEPAKQKP
jgi:hypothetical protein